MVSLKLIATLTDTSGNPLPSRTIEFYRSTDGVNYTLIGIAITDSNGQASLIDEVTEPGRYYYKARFPGDELYEASEATATYEYAVPAAKPIWQQPWFLLLLFILFILLFAGGGGGGAGGTPGATTRRVA